MRVQDLENKHLLTPDHTTPLLSPNRQTLMVSILLSFDKFLMVSILLSMLINSCMLPQAFT